MTTIFNPSGEVLHVPDPTPAELSAAMVEACLRAVLRSIKDGNLTGAFCPDPLSKYRAEWGPLFTGCDLIEVQIYCAGDPTHEERTAAWTRMRELGHEPVIAIHEKPEAISYDLTIEVAHV